uniref:Uncharacterized protein n=1 Tax=Daphnia magna TaxID=35525 RepID=A0A0P5CNW4_9CRUS
MTILLLFSFLPYTYPPCPSSHSRNVPMGSVQACFVQQNQVGFSPATVLTFVSFPLCSYY